MTDKGLRGSKYQEIMEEFRSVMSGRGGWIDSLIPPVAFIIINAFVNFNIALLVASAAAILIVIYRLIKRQSLRYAFGGVGGVLVAVMVAKLVGSAQGYFLPGIVTGSATAIICLISIIIKRPLVAWTSYITRRWPLGWYWHPKVRPAYNEVTLAWGIFFAIRAILQFQLFLRGEAATLGIVQLILGWPVLILLLISSYLYGLWRLQHLEGPSVKEFTEGVNPPWGGQKRGF